MQGKPIFVQGHGTLAIIVCSMENAAQHDDAFSSAFDVIAYMYIADLPAQQRPLHHYIYL